MTKEAPGVSDGVVLDIANQFGLSRPASWSVLSSSWTTNLRLDVDGRSFVARIHSAWTDHDRLSAIQAVRVSAARAGIPTVEPLLTPDGQPIVTGPGGSLVELEPFLAWDARMNTPSLLTRGFGTLGRLHDVLSDLDLPAARNAPHANHLPSDTAAELTREAVARIDSWNDPMLSHSSTAILHHIEAVTEAESEVAPGQISQLVHGDFWDNNVLFAGQDLVAVIDFDFLGERWRIDDLALPIWFYLLEPGHDLPAEQERQLVRRLIDAYDSGTARPLSLAERLALPLAIARQPAWSMGRWVLQLDEPDARGHARSAAEQFSVAQKVISDLPAWQEVLSVGARDTAS